MKLPIGNQLTWEQIKLLELIADEQARQELTLFEIPCET